MTLKEIREIIAHEGDTHSWIYNGMSCSMQRNSVGCWCGYVTIPASFPDENYQFINVHGGLTYENRNEDGLMLGFDCAHHGDLCPEMIKYFMIDGEYRDKDYVISETESMVDQILNMVYTKRNGKIIEILKKDK